MNCLDENFTEDRTCFLKNHELLFQSILEENVINVKRLTKERPALLEQRNPLYQTPYIFAKFHNKERVYSILKTAESEKDWETYQKMQRLFTSIHKEEVVFNLEGYKKEDFAIPDPISRNSAIFVAIDKKKKEWIGALYPFCKNHLSNTGRDVFTYVLHAYPQAYRFVEGLEQ